MPFKNQLDNDTIYIIPTNGSKPVKVIFENSKSVDFDSEYSEFIITQKTTIPKRDLYNFYNSIFDYKTMNLTKWQLIRLRIRLLWANFWWNIRYKLFKLK